MRSKNIYPKGHMSKNYWHIDYFQYKVYILYFLNNYIMSINSKLVSKIPTAQEIKHEFPLNTEWKQIVADSKVEIWKILSWESKKIILIIGPCSADFQKPLEEYAQFISEMRNLYNDKIEIIMRFYTGKPRTVWWWKWLSNSKPWDKPDIARWIIDSRTLAISLIEKYKIPLADEMLHPQLINMFDDIYSYLAIWARSTENQYHREVASWVDIPIGFKNPTSWDIDVMTNSIAAGQTPSSYVLWNRVYDSTGNNMSHGILRWWRVNGTNFSNFWQSDLFQASQMLFKKWIHNPWFIVDTNHENSNKQYQNQINIMITVIENIKKLQEKWTNIQPFFKWFMTESYLIDGRQDWPKDNDETKIIPWCSLTDPCIWKEKTQVYLEELYKRLPL
jgi:3-deoxy-7-phosphoheptulonate synthase